MTFRCSVVAIGTELLLGQIVDTNSSWIGEQLALAGINSHIQMKVGDNHDRMVDMLGVALDRPDAVIVCAPRLRSVVTDPPVPSGPSRLDDHESEPPGSGPS